MSPSLRRKSSNSQLKNLTAIWRKPRKLPVACVCLNFLGTSREKPSLSKSCSSPPREVSQCLYRLPVDSHMISEANAPPKSTFTAWEETGEIPDDKGMKIQQSPKAGHSPTTSTASKQPARKKKKANPNIKPVDLMNKEDDPPANSQLGTTSDHSATPAQLASSLQNPATSAISDPPPTEHPANPQDSITPSENQGDNPDLPVSTDDQPPIPPANAPPADAQNTTEDLIPATHTKHPQPHNENPTPQQPQGPTPSVPAGGIPQPIPSDQTQHTNTGSAPAQSSSAKSNPVPDDPAHNESTPLTNTNVTIIKSTDVRIQLIKLHQELDGVKPNWQKYQTVWNSLLKIIEFHALSTRSLDTQSADFHFQRTACSYASWIKTISSLGRSHHSDYLTILLKQLINFG